MTTLPGGRREMEELPPDGIMVPYPHTWTWQRVPGLIDHYKRGCCGTLDNEKMHKPDCRWWVAPPDNPGAGLPISSGDVHKVLGDPQLVLEVPKGLAEDIMIKHNLNPQHKLAMDLDQLPATEQAQRILEHHLPRIVNRFIANNAKYRRVGTDRLGPRGVIPDINRKVGVVIDRVWDGNDSPGESTPEVIEDLIGHLLLLHDALLSEEVSDMMMENGDASV